MDEPNILDRVYSHGCDGFIGFYSTLPATSLSKNFDGLKAKINIQSFDREYIEKTLLKSPQGLKLASRYFPTSFGKYKAENPQPVTIFTDEPRILCECCNKNLLEEGAGIFVILKKYTDCEEKETTTSLYEEAYFSCKGYCDVVLKEKYLKNGDYLDSWIDISDFLSPTHYLMRMMAWMNEMNLNNEKLEKAAFDKLKKLFINSFPHIAREQTTKEKEKIKHYLQNGWGDLL